jgi:hypothetical protein
VSRTGPEVDRVITDLVLAKIEADADRVAVDGPDWDGAPALTGVEERMAGLRVRYLAGELSDDNFYPLLAGLEKQARELRADRDRHTTQVARATRDVQAVRERWQAAPEDGGYDMAQKRALVKEAVHAIVVRPGRRGRGPFDPSLLEFRWRTT